MTKPRMAARRGAGHVGGEEEGEGIAGVGLGMRRGRGEETARHQLGGG